jgi:hypothetical protein
MGTLSKLDTNVRAARTRRAVASKEVARGAHSLRGRDRLALSALNVLLEEVRNDPTLTALQKDQKFRSIMNRNR